jgi:hypothetical protein
MPLRMVLPRRDIVTYKVGLAKMPRSEWRAESGPRSSPGRIMWRWDRHLIDEASRECDTTERGAAGAGSITPSSL